MFQITEINECYEHKILFKCKEAYHFTKLLVVSFRENNALYAGELTHASYPRCACALTSFVNKGDNNVAIYDK